MAAHRQQVDQNSADHQSQHRQADEIDRGEHDRRDRRRRCAPTIVTSNSPPRTMRPHSQATMPAIARTMPANGRRAATGRAASAAPARTTPDSSRGTRSLPTRASRVLGPSGGGAGGWLWRIGHSGSFDGFIRWPRRARPPNRRDARLELADRLLQHFLVEVRPVGVKEDELRIGELPEQEIRQAHLAAGADQQIRIGNAVRVRGRPRSARA